MLWVVWRVVTAGSAIYMGGQMGVFAEIPVTYPRPEGTMHRFALPPAEVLNIERGGYIYVLLLIEVFVDGPGAISELRRKRTGRHSTYRLIQSTRLSSRSALQLQHTQTLTLPPNYKGVLVVALVSA